jgi:hypothetical protein
MIEESDTDVVSNTGGHANGRSSARRLRSQRQQRTKTPNQFLVQDSKVLSGFEGVSSMDDFTSRLMARHEQTKWLAPSVLPTSIDITPMRETEFSNIIQHEGSEI